MAVKLSIQYPHHLMHVSSLSFVSLHQQGIGATRDTTLLYVHEFSLLLTMKGGLLKSHYYWMGRESWHAIKKLLNLPFLILKVRYPAIKDRFYGFLYYGVAIVMNSNVHHHRRRAYMGERSTNRGSSIVQHAVFYLSETCSASKEEMSSLSVCELS